MGAGKSLMSNSHPVHIHASHLFVEPHDNTLVMDAEVV